MPPDQARIEAQLDRLEAQLAELKAAHDALRLDIVERVGPVRGRIDLLDLRLTALESRAQEDREAARKVLWAALGAVGTAALSAAGWLISALTR